MAVSFSGNQITSNGFSGATKNITNINDMVESFKTRQGERYRLNIAKQVRDDEILNTIKNNNLNRENDIALRQMADDSAIKAQNSKNENDIKIKKMDIDNRDNLNSTNLAVSQFNQDRTLKIDEEKLKEIKRANDIATNQNKLDQIQDKVDSQAYSYYLANVMKKDKSPKENIIENLNRNYGVGGKLQNSTVTPENANAIALSLNRASDIKPDGVIDNRANIMRETLNIFGKDISNEGIKSLFETEKEYFDASNKIEDRKIKEDERIKKEAKEKFVNSPEQIISAFDPLVNALSKGGDEDAISKFTEFAYDFAEKYPNKFKTKKQMIDFISRKIKENKDSFYEFGIWDTALEDALDATMETTSY